MGEGVVKRRAAMLYPSRGDDVEAWLKRQRDSWYAREDRWQALDAALDDYREHADTGTPLHLDVPEPR